MFVVCCVSLLLVTIDEMLFCLFFFFKQKTAYEMLRSLVGSEMCIRDSFCPCRKWPGGVWKIQPPCTNRATLSRQSSSAWICLLYTSDAADDLLCVDLGGRRIIKKKKTYHKLSIFTSSSHQPSLRNTKRTDYHHPTHS